MHKGWARPFQVEPGIYLALKKKEHILSIALCVYLSTNRQNPSFDWEVSI